MSTLTQFAQMDMPNDMWLVVMCIFMCLVPIHIWEFFHYHEMDIYSTGFAPAVIQFVALAVLLGATPFVFRKVKWPPFIRYGFLPVGYVLITLVTNFMPKFYEFSQVAQ